MHTTRKPSDGFGRMAPMHWLYYVLGAAAVVVVLNLVLMLALVWAAREPD